MVMICAHKRDQPESYLALTTISSQAAPRINNEAGPGFKRNANKGAVNIKLDTGKEFLKKSDLMNNTWLTPKSCSNGRLNLLDITATGWYRHKKCAKTAKKYDCKVMENNFGNIRGSLLFHIVSAYLCIFVFAYLCFCICFIKNNDGGTCG